MRALGKIRARAALRTRARRARDHLRVVVLQRRLAGPRLLSAFADSYPDAVFVEIGSNDGKQHDHLRPHILARQWSGVMVEPVPYVFARLRESYGDLRRVSFENAAIAGEDGDLPFYHLREAAESELRSLPSWYDGIGSFSRESVLGHARDIPGIRERLTCTSVPTLSFESLYRKHGLERLDLLLLDTEGFDWEVLQTIDFKRHRPRLVVYEHYHLNHGEREAALEHFRRLGYEALEEGFDTFCLDPTPDALTRRFRSLRPAVPGGSVRDEPNRGAEPRPDLNELTAEDRRYLTSLYDASTPLPQDAGERLRSDHPRLRDLCERYAALRLQVLEASRWRDEAVADFLDLRYFRGETLITWHYRELSRVSELKFFVLLQYVRRLDTRGLLDRLEEDGSFGCWTYEYPGHPRVSRDLLESVNEIAFLERRLELSAMPGFRVLDIGAGYGRLAHRMVAAYPNLDDYCCVDAIPQSTFLSEYYLEHRVVIPPARVAPLDDFATWDEPGQFDLAINIHSFPECTLAAIDWWLTRLAQLDVPRLLIVPNESDALLSLEPDGTRHDFAGLLERAGYRLAAREPVIADPAVRELLRLEDHFLLFERTGD